MPRTRGLMGLALVGLVGLGGCSWPQWAGRQDSASVPEVVERPQPPPPSTAAEGSEPAPAPRVNARLVARPPGLARRDPAVTEPACTPTLDDDGHLVVGQQTQPLRFDRDREHRLPRLSVWRYRDDAVLVADRPRWRLNQGTPTQGTLWLVPCDGTSPPVAAATMQQADFGNAVLANDGRTLYLTGPAGVMGLDLDRRTISAVTEAPPLRDPDCRELYGSRTPTHYRDVVRGLDRRGRLVIERGSYCGFEGDWLGERQRVELPTVARDDRMLARHERSSDHPRR
ncbi:MAG: hypothetical protein AB1Z98_24350 [Nannocystaceae bacterium]